MAPITRSAKLFLAVIAAAALFVAVVGVFAPAYLATLFSWVVLPPLHARFVGSIYAFGAVYMLLCLRANRQAPAQWAILLITVWTGLLGLISILNLSAFNLAQLPAQIWFASYLGYPLIGAGLLAATHTQLKGGGDGQPLPPWARRFLWAQGGFVSAIAIGLLLAPAGAAVVWPWPITPLLAQLYSGPLLAYGVGSMLCAYKGTWAGTAALVPAMLVFTSGALVASIIHRNLFGISEWPDWIWFGTLASATLGLGTITAELARRVTHPPEASAQEGESSSLVNNYPAA